MLKKKKKKRIINLTVRLREKLKRCRESKQRLKGKLRTKRDHRIKQHRGGK